MAHPAHNDEGNGGGVVTLLNATAQSLNCAYIRLAHEVGLANVISLAHSLGISETLPEFPSIVIGSVAVHPIEMAAAYAAVADNGVYHAPSFVDHIVDRSGSTIYVGASPGKQVVSPQIAQEATVALQAVVQSGTGTAAALVQPAGRGQDRDDRQQRGRLVQRLHPADGVHGLDGQWQRRGADARRGWGG